jgi:transposase
MEVLYRVVSGLDVHKKTVVACVRRVGEEGRVWKEVRTFGTMTTNLRALGQWLRAEGVTHVAMESTGVFWKPVYNLLEDEFTLVLVNAHHIKQVPGRKTDVKDCEWIAQLLQCGLLRASFVPARAQREWRDLTRHRTKLMQQHSAVINRLQAVLEDANIKLSAVASEVLGASGRDMIEALIGAETNAERLAELARGRLRGKIPQLRVALEGKVAAHHRFMLRLLLDQLDFLSTAVDACSQRLTEIAPESFHQAVRQLTTIKGVGRRTAEIVLAEIGTDLKSFPSAKHLCSWAGVCPGNHESAGKRQSGKPAKGNRWLRGALTEAAWGAVLAKNNYFAAQYRRVAGRRGKHRAIGAVAHSLLCVCYHVLHTGQPYHDLGADHFERLDPQRLRRHYVRKLERLGYKVTLDTQEAA